MGIPGTRPLDHWITGSLDHWITGSLDHWITGSLDHWITSSPAHQSTRAPAHQLTSSPAHQLTSSPAHQLTSSPEHQSTRAPERLFYLLKRRFFLHALRGSDESHKSTFCTFFSGYFSPVANISLFSPFLAVFKVKQAVYFFTFP